MGFPRILSKNNKIYTKLGEFCLAGDSFWIVCHTCQEELQTQDAFWKHIQDEHNFLHGVAKEHSRTSSYCLTDVEAATTTTAAGTTTQTAGGVVPVGLYCGSKYSDEEHREVTAAVELHEVAQQQQQQQHQQQQHQQQQQQQQQHQQQHHLQQQQQQRDAAKDLAELHAVGAVAATVESGARSSNSGIDIKVEPTSLTLTTEMQEAAVTAASTVNTTIYHLSQVVPAPPPPPPTTPSFVNAGTSTTVNVSTATTHTTLPGAVASNNPIMQQQACNTLTMSQAAAVAAAGIPLLAAQELAPKDSNSTTASASSAVSSDDGERWYICDYGTCGLKFKYKSRMELHRVVHSKVRRFNCDMCSASFKQSCNLSTHRKKKHSVRGIKSELLPQRF